MEHTHGHWNLKAFYPSLEAWDKDYEIFKDRYLSGTSPWSTVNCYQHRLAEGPKELLQALDAFHVIERHLDKLFTYSHLLYDMNLENSEAAERYSQASILIEQFSQATAWLRSEICQFPPDLMNSYIASPLLSAYSAYLERLSWMSPHTLDSRGEEIVALASPGLSTGHLAFRMLNDAELSFSDILDSQGKSHPLSHSRYSQYQQSPDRKLRKEAFFALHKQYGQFEKTYAELLQGSIKSRCSLAKIRDYPSACAAALIPHGIDPIIYDRLIQSVEKGLPLLHRYLSLKKKWLELDRLFPYDLLAPLVGTEEKKVDFPAACDLVIEAMAPLGKEYQQRLHTGLTDERWADVFPAPAKRSGAYSSGCYDSHPYMLLNFEGTARDLSTLAHEAGHSMHTLYSKENQPYQDAGYPIFLAEIASTVNEVLLFAHKMKVASSKRDKKALILNRLQDILSTLFRQTQFAHFERDIHDMVFRHEPLTAERITSHYADLVKRYYGPDMEWEDL
ncbi:MAG: M3 family oligoendopeptidase, partial [Chlamydiota bacterium]|nr:M3 family oligoendopeptidase [Chlamydiota bacterium]